MTDQPTADEQQHSDEHSLATKGEGNKQYVVEEEWSTVNVPMFRPKPEFLSILKMAGASGEIFTNKEICQLLKDYIGSRHMYDADDPRVVYCGNDPLGKVFQCEKFTVDQALSLFSKNCTPVPDTCIKRKRHLVSKPVSIQSTPTSQSPPGSFTIAVCRSSPVITSSSDFHDHDLKSRKLPTYSLLKQRKSSSSSTGSGKRKERQEVNQSSLAVSPKQEDENQSGKMVEHSPCDSRQSEESKSTTEGGNSKKKRNRKRKRKSGRDSAGSPGQLTEAASEPGPSRKRGTSLSITYNDSENSAYPWYFQLQVEDDDDNEDSEILSIQDRTTATVQDSTDDLWFVEEESIAVEVDTDTEFAVEYDIESDDDSPLTESDISSVKSGEGLLVVCKESDVEFFADYSDSDSEDTEITEADKWICTECKHVNTPPQRYCDRCWKLRTGWLPDIPHITSNRQGSQSKSSSIYFDSERTGKLGEEADDKSSSAYEAAKCVKSSSVYEAVSDAKSSSIYEAVKSSFDSPDIDSGIGGFSSNYPSSQETVRSFKKELAEPQTKSLKENDVCLSPLLPRSNDSLLDEARATEVRHTFSNFRKNASSSLESLNIKDDDKITAGKITTPLITDPCMICLSKPKTASLVHGSSGHQVCCFPCAKRLKRRGKVCPVCRRPIQKVIKNYIL